MKSKNELFGWIFGLAIAIGLGTVYYSAIVSPFLNGSGNVHHTGYQLFLNRWVQDINQSCPVQMTEDVRLDSCTTSNLRINYYYTLSHKMSSALTTESMDIMSSNLIEQVTTDPGLNGMRKNEVSFAYYYFDINGMLVFSKLISPEDYAVN